VRGCRLRGRPVGSRRRRLFPLPVPWVSVWMPGVDERRVLSPRGATNKGEEMSGRVCPDGGLCEEPGGPLPGWVMSRLTGPSRPSEIPFVELLLPRRSPSNSALREFSLRGMCPTTQGPPLTVAACLDCFVLPGEKEVKVPLFFVRPQIIVGGIRAAGTTRKGTLEVGGLVPSETG